MSEKREHASQAEEALFKVMSSAPVGPQFTAESDFPRQRAITKQGCPSASFSELIVVS